MSSFPRRVFRRLRHAVRRWTWRRMPGRDGGSAPIRLHLGCGSDRWPGYVNVDVSPEADCDLCMDFSDIGRMFAEGSVAEAAMIHSLGYLRLWQARELFADLHRLLAPGGRLIVELPDLEKCSRTVLAREAGLPAYLEGVRGLYAFGMDQIERREAFVPYAFGWSGWHLKSELEKAGFRNVRVLDPLLHGACLERDVRVEATK